MILYLVADTVLTNWYSLETSGVVLYLIADTVLTNCYFYRRETFEIAKRAISKRSYKSCKNSHKIEIEK